MPMTPQELISNLGDLPPLPTVATRVIQMTTASDTSSEDLQNLIRMDPALAAQVLKVANSAMFGMVREVSTLTQAILTLGFFTTRSVVLAASIKNLFARGPAGPKEHTLWEHALVTALMGSAFSKALKVPESEEVFLAGLMHDIGKNVLALKFPEGYSTLLRRVGDGEGEGLLMELDTFGFDHAMVGEALLSSWNISEGLEAVARWHHDPLRAVPEHRRLVAFVALGNQAALDLRAGLGAPESLLTATRGAMHILGMDGVTYRTYQAMAREAFDRDKALITEF